MRASDVLQCIQAGALDEEASASFTDDLALSWSEGQTFALTPEQVRGLSREDLIKIWKVSRLKPIGRVKLSFSFFKSVSVIETSFSGALPLMQVS